MVTISVTEQSAMVDALPIVITDCTPEVLLKENIP